MTTYFLYQKVTLGKSRKKLEKKHWVEMVENPRRPIIHWHQLKVHYDCTHNLVHFFALYFRNLSLGTMKKRKRKKSQAPKKLKSHNSMFSW